MSPKALQDLLPAHMSAASIAVLVLCGLILSGYAIIGINRWRWRKALRRHGRW